MTRPSPIADSPNGNCRRYGHDWDIERPSVFSPAYVPPSVMEIVATCQRCGLVQTDYPDGTRVSTWPQTYTIVRFRFEGDNEVIKRGLTLEEAQAHCQRDDTHGDGWFDGYREDS